MQLTNQNTSKTTGRVINFGAGPAALPVEVLEQFCQDLINFESTGVGVAELSHRGGAFEKGILGRAKERFFRLCGYEEGEWSLLWMTGGGTGQFASVPLNYLDDVGVVSKGIYLLSGIWSEKAAGEAERLCPGGVLKVDLRRRSGKGEISLLSQVELSDQIAQLRQSHPKIAYLYACDNETVDGLELPSPDWITSIAQGLPVVLDCSSNFLSRPLPPPDSAIELIFAGVQKNLGGAGVTVVLKRKHSRNGSNDKASNVRSDKVSNVTSDVRSDVANMQASTHTHTHPNTHAHAHAHTHTHTHTHIPAVMDYAVMEKHDSLLNTPPVMNIHLCSLMLDWLLKRFPGGLKEIDEFSKRKAKLLYDCLAASENFYCDIDGEFRSRMNVVFHGKEVSQEQELLKQAEAMGMIQLKGHRSVGGLRASLYNSIEESSVIQLTHLMKVD